MTAYAAAGELYRRSWEIAPPKSYGRLVGLLKASVLSGAADQGAAYVRGQLAAEATGEPSATAGYVLAVAALVAGDDEGAARFAGAMRGASDPHDRTADAIAGLAAGDAEAYRAAVEAIVADFAARHRRRDRRHRGDARSDRAPARRRGEPTRAAAARLTPPAWKDAARCPPSSRSATTSHPAASRPSRSTSPTRAMRCRMSC